MARNTRWLSFLFLVVLSASLLVACAPQAAVPTPTPIAKAPVSTSQPAAGGTTTSATSAGTAKPAATTAASPKPATTAAAAPAKTTNIKVGHLAVSSVGGLYYAMEKGLFAQEGINIELVSFKSITEMIAPLSKGELDIGHGSVAAGLFNAVSRGVDAKIVGGTSELPPGNKYAVWLIRKDLVGQVKDYSDLKGKKIAISSMGGLGEVALAKALAKANLTMSSVEVVQLGFPDMIVALGNNSVDLAYGLEPYITTALEKGVAAPWKDISEVIPNYQIGIWLASPQFVGPNREVAKRWMVAWLKGAREYTDVFFKNKGDKAGVVASLIKYTSIKDPALYDKMGPVSLSFNGYVMNQNISEQQDYYSSVGGVQSKVNIDALVDNGLADYAVQLLGKYQ